MGQYLDKFAGSINKNQADQILKLLNKQKNTGQIRSVKEFSEKLETLMNEITSTVLTPTLKVWAGEKGQDIDSESYNFMLDRVEDDLQAAFEEAGNIDEVQRSHEAITRDVILKNLKAGVAELEAKVDLFEFLNKDVRGFDSAIFSTFRESKAERTPRQGAEAEVLFRDPRLHGELVPSTEDAVAELIGERLVLPVFDTVQHSIGSVRQIFDAEAIQSELAVEPPDTSLQNMIDDTSGTYWIQSLLFDEFRPYTKVKLELDLGMSKEISYIEIEPASRQPIVLESVHYIGPAGVITDLEIDEQTIDSPMSLKTSKFASNRLILTFRNENSRHVEFEYNSRTPLWNQAIQEPATGFVPDMRYLDVELIEIVPSPGIADVIGLPSPEAPRQSVRNKNTRRSYEFTMGIDNIRVGLSKYSNRGIYASAPLAVEDLGELGIKTVESRPYLVANETEIKFASTTYDLDQDSSFTDDDTITAGEKSRTLFLGSVEYWIFKLDQNENGVLNRTTTFPILPLDTDRIYHERLVLNGKSNTSIVLNDLGSTMFFTNRTDGDIKVYRNGFLLGYDTADGWSDATEAVDRTANSGAPMTFKIQVTSQLPGDVFTVSYNPVLSSTSSVPKTITEFTSIGGLNVVDLVGDLSARANAGQVVGIDRKSDGTKANVFLVVILRQNTAQQSLTPAVEEYTLVAGRKDPTKFEEV